MKLRLVLAGFCWLLLPGCGSPPPYRTLYEVPSPDGRLIARLEGVNEGTLGSTRFRLIILKAGDTQGREVFSGTEADTDPPSWLSSSALLVPFCFGQIESVQSVTPIDSGEETRFRNRTSSNLRIHIITAPFTAIAGKTYCPNV